MEADNSDAKPIGSQRQNPSLQVSMFEDDQDRTGKDEKSSAEMPQAEDPPNNADRVDSPHSPDLQTVVITQEPLQEEVHLQSKNIPITTKAEASQPEFKSAFDPARSAARALKFSSATDSPRIDSSEGDRLQVPRTRRRSSWFRAAAAGRRGSLKPAPLHVDESCSNNNKTIKNQLSEWLGAKSESRSTSLVSLDENQMEDFPSSSRSIPIITETAPDFSSARIISQPKNGKTRQSIFARSLEKPEKTEEFWEKLEKRTLIYPDSSYLRMWDLFIGTLILYTALLIPYVLGFGVELTGGWMIWDVFVDFCFMINIGVIFRTVVVDENDTITDWRRIAKKYLRSWFILDIVASFPFSMVIMNPRYSHPLRVPRLIRLTRLLRLAKVNIWASTSNTSRVLQMSLQFSVIAHWLGCAWYYVSRIQTPTSKYLRTLSWGFTNLAGLGGNLNPETDAECILTLIVVVISLFVFATIIGSMNSAIANLDRTQSRFRDRLQGVNEFMRYRRLPTTIRHKIRQYYERIWYLNQGLDERDILEDLPRDLKMEVATHVHRNLLQKVPLFRDSEEAFIRALCLKIKPEICPPEDFIFRQGERGAEMYFISRGKVKILGADYTTVIAELGDGSYFGEIALLTNVMRTASAQAVEVCELFVLHKTDFDELVKQYPNVARKIQQVAQEREKTKGLTFSPASRSQTIESIHKQTSAEDGANNAEQEGTPRPNTMEQDIGNQAVIGTSGEGDEANMEGRDETAAGDTPAASEEHDASKQEAAQTHADSHPESREATKEAQIAQSSEHTENPPQDRPSSRSSPLRRRTLTPVAAKDIVRSLRFPSSSPSPTSSQASSIQGIHVSSHHHPQSGLRPRLRSLTPPTHSLAPSSANSDLHSPLPPLPGISHEPFPPQRARRASVADNFGPDDDDDLIPPDETDDLVKRINTPTKIHKHRPPT